PWLLLLLNKIALDNALVALEKQVEIGKCNMRIDPKKNQKEPTYQIVLDALALTTCYQAFLITASVPIEKKWFSVDMEVFREILQICPRLPDQEFDEPPSEEEILSFIKELGHIGKIKNITAVVVNHMHQPWRTFASISGGKLPDKNVKESWALIEDLALFDNESWNDPRDLAKPIKAISLPHNVPNASDRRFIELED
ncbi:hypothetical protein Tco_1104778, partial [Tanacetum coccineum]